MTVTVQSRLREPTVPVTCPHCKTELEYLKISIPANESFKISCARCARPFDGPSPASSSRGKQAASRRRIGTQTSPLDTAYYDILEVSVDADLDTIKKSYRKLALKHHPDKLSAAQRTPEAEEKFKQISIAYAVLSNPEERRKYNEYGPASKQQENGFVDPEQVFSSLFGGERFEDLIGKVSIGAEMKSALQKEEEQQESDPSSDKVQKAQKAKKDMTAEEREQARVEAEKKKEQERAEAAERARVRKERVKELHAKLLKKISIFTEQAATPSDEPVRKSVRAIWTIEAEELKDESHGVELLQSIGTTYLQKAQQYSAASGTPLGLGGWWSGMKQTATLFSDTYSTLRSAYELTDIVSFLYLQFCDNSSRSKGLWVSLQFKELAAAEEKGLSEEKRKELEEKAATKGMQALFKASLGRCC